MPFSSFLAILLLTPLAFASSVGLEEPKKFENPELLATTEWIAEHGSKEGVVIADVRGPDDYATAHIDGAVHLPMADTFDKNSRWNIAPPEQIAKLLGSKGISNETHVVLYDGGRSVAAARVFWTLEVYGHAKVSVLDGGFTKWLAEKRDTTKNSVAPKATEYEIDSPTECRSTGKQLLEEVDDPDVVMLDARSDREFGGGRLPNAVHVDWVRNFTEGEVPVFKSATELYALYEDLGVTIDKRVHAY